MNFIPSIWGFKFKIFRQMLSRLKDNFIIFEAWSGDTLLGISTFLTGLRIHIILYESRSNFSFWCIRLLSEANIFWQQNLFQIKNVNVYFFFIFNVLKLTRSGIPDRDPCFFKSGSGSATLGPVRVSCVPVLIFIGHLSHRNSKSILYLERFYQHYRNWLLP